MKIHYACKDINNFGDIVPSYIYNRMGLNVEWASADEADIFAGGSIMQEARESNEILCCGFGNPDEVCQTPKKIHSVRGPLTRKRLLELGIDCPEIYQDMVDLLPYFYYPKVEKIYNVGYLPHYIDHADFLEMFPNDLVIDITSGVENVINEMLKCKFIITTSLHGIIACHNYEINWQWAKHKELASPDFKFQDYFERIGLGGLKPNII